MVNKVDLPEKILPTVCHSIVAEPAHYAFMLGMGPLPGLRPMRESTHSSGPACGDGLTGSGCTRKTGFCTL